MKRIVIIVTVLYSIFFLILPAIAQSNDLAIGDYTLVSQKRITRTVWEIVYTANVTNSGSAAFEVTATVTSNSSRTTIIDGSLSFGDVAGGTTITSTDTFTIRHDRSYPFDPNALVWTISSNSTGPISQWIGPSGGILTFPNGVILDIPEGAVDDDTLIEINDLDFDQANQIIGINQFKGQMRILGGFNAEPDGLSFSTPIKAIFPVIPLLPGEVPLPLKISLDQATYQIRSNELLYDGSKGVVEMQVDHFSGVAATGYSTSNNKGTTIEMCQTNADDVYQTCMDKDIPENTKENYCQGERAQYFKICSEDIKFNEKCLNPDSCNTFSANEDFCAAFDTTQDSCCQMAPEMRAKCFTSCNCCKEGKVWVKADETDWQGGNGCQIVNGQIEVVYLDCPGQERQEIHAAASTCDLAVTLSGPSTMNVGETATYTAMVAETGTGNIFNNVPLTWTTTRPDILEIISATGQIATVRGVGLGTAIIKAETPDPEQFGAFEVAITTTVDYYSHIKITFLTFLPSPSTFAWFDLDYDVLVHLSGEEGYIMLSNGIATPDYHGITISQQYIPIVASGASVVGGDRFNGTISGNEVHGTVMVEYYSYFYPVSF